MKKKNIRKYLPALLLCVCVIWLSVWGKLETRKEELPDNGIPRLEITLKDTTLETLCEEEKGIRYGGNQVTLSDTDGSQYTDPSVEIRGRGNSSWKMPKRSWQLTFSQKIRPFGLNASKKWLLIANYADASLMRNKLLYDLAGELMAYAPESCFVDLWIDGSYQGSYLLCEKIEIGEHRADLKDQKGILIEMDNIYWYEGDYFRSQVSGSCFILKDAVDETYAQEAFLEMEDYMNRFESLLYSEEKDWEEISSMIDVDSFIKYYYIQELAENSDSCRTSVYLYKDGPEDLLHMGPVWDFDKAAGYSMRGKYGGDPANDYVKNIEEYMGTGKDTAWWTEFFQIPEFRQEARRIWQDEIYEVFASSGERICAYQQTLQQSAEANFELWDISKIPENCDHEPCRYRSWEDAVNGLSEWIEARTAYLNTAVQKEAP